MHLDVDGVTTREDFGSQYLRITADNVTSRVQLEIMDQDVQVKLDPDGSGNDLFVQVLGFAKTQAPLHAAGNEYYATVQDDPSNPGLAVFVIEWRLNGQSGDRGSGWHR